MDKNRPQSNLEEAAELDKLFYRLVDDVITSAELWHLKGDDFARRTYVRSLFSMIEGVTYMMKRSALLFDQINRPPQLSLQEVMLLREETVSLQDNGKAQTKPVFLPLIPNIRFAISCYAKARQIE